MSMHSTLAALSDKYDATSIPMNEVPIITTLLPCKKKRERRNKLQFVVVYFITEDAHAIMLACSGSRSRYTDSKPGTGKVRGLFDNIIYFKSVSFLYLDPVANSKLS